MVRLLVAVLLLLGAATLLAAPPKRLSYLDIGVGAQPEVVQAWFAKRYPSCAPTNSLYRPAEGYPPKLVADYFLNRSYITECHESSGPAAIADSVNIRLAHPAVDPSRAAYLIDIKRAYPDVLFAPGRKVLYPFGRMRDELFRAYGKPLEERRISVSSASADLARSLGQEKNLVRTDYLVRYLWATKGRLTDDNDRESTVCDCGPAYVKADIEISQSPSTSPRNQLYVLSLAMYLEDSAVRTRQDEWNAQWQRRK